MSTVERLIGIDFGTSTTVMCYLDFLDGKAFGKNTFVSLDPESRRDPRLLDSLVYDPPPADGERRFGRLARTMYQRYLQQGLVHVGTLAQAFKMDLLDQSKRSEALARMSQLFEEVYRRYQLHKEREPLERGMTLVERTFVSYPALWSQPLREATIEAARSAGFENVEGMDEPSAAMKFFLHYEVDRFKDLERRGVVRRPEPVVVLLIDMGAGTSDFVLFKTVLGSSDAKILSTWPTSTGSRSSSEDTLGGRHIDAILFEYFDDYLERNRTADSSRTLPRDVIIRHKEHTLSPHLRQNRPVDVDDFEELSRLRAYDLRPDAEPYGIDRTAFGKRIGSHIEMFVRLLDGALADAVSRRVIRSVGEVDLVLLTGGHSQWYFFEQVLCGEPIAGHLPDATTRDALGRLKALKTATERRRLLVQGDPQTIVARGLVVPVEIEPIAANNFWYEIKVEIRTAGANGGDIVITKSARIVVVGRGDKLPLKREGLYRLEIDRPAAQALQINASIAPVVGPSFDQGERFGASRPMKAEVRPATGDGTESILVDFYIEVTVGKNERASYVGYLGFDPTYSKDTVFGSRNRPQPDSTEIAALGRKWLDKRSRPDETVRLA